MVLRVGRDPEFRYPEALPDVPIERASVSAMGAGLGSRMPEAFKPYVWQHPDNLILPGFPETPVLDLAPEPPKPKRKPCKRAKPRTQPWHRLPTAPEPAPPPPTYRVTPGTARPSPGWRAANGEDIESWLSM